LKISSAAGGEQEVKVAEGAKIVTSDGAQASLGEIKEGRPGARKLRLEQRPGEPDRGELEAEGQGGREVQDHA